MCLIDLAKVAMPNYDFKQLSPFDFELLIAGLLTAEWGVKLEAFKSGRDGGIDLRYSNPIGFRNEIVQCKHYVISGYNKLYSDLKKEVPKVKTLNPKRYGIATSVALTAGNKDAIKQLFDPYILTTGDIFGQTDINLMLERHPEVEKANFKLWFTSTAVLEKVLNNAVHCQTDFQIDKIIAKFPRYVQNNAYPKAIDILRENNVVVISGVPGIGKTTLAEMLIYNHLEHGYSPVAVTTSLVEGRRLFNKSIPQVFYFDDFLGRTFLRENQGYTLRKEDAALVDFIEMIQNSANSKLIMTTREHIFSNAIMGSEKLRHSPIIDHKCVLTLADYSPLDRAKILYNHIYFSKLPPEYIEQMLKNGFYKQILKHRNFNPRLIEWLSSFRRVKGTPPEKYQAFVAAVLDNPNEIWRDAFFNQISGAARSLLLFLYSIGGTSHTTQCEFGWVTLYAYQSSRYNTPMSEEGFQAPLKEIEGSFITIENNKLDFINPSVTDFLTTLLSENNGYIEDILGSATYLAQILYLWSVKLKTDVYLFRGAMVQDMSTFAMAVSRTTKRPAYEVIKSEKMTALRINDVTPEKRMMGLVEISHTTQSLEIWDVARDYMDEVEHYWNDGYLCFEDTILILDKLERTTSGVIVSDPTFYSSIRYGLFTHIEECNTYSDFIFLEEYAKGAVPELTDDENEAFSESFLGYAKRGISDDLYNMRSDGDGLRSLADFLETMTRTYGYSLKAQLEMVNSALADYDEREERNADEDYEHWKESRSDERADDRAIDNLFETLK